MTNNRVINSREKFQTKQTVRCSSECIWRRAGQQQLNRSRGATFSRSRSSRHRRRRRTRARCWCQKSKEDQTSSLPSCRTWRDGCHREEHRLFVQVPARPAVPMPQRVLQGARAPAPRKAQVGDACTGTCVAASYQFDASGSKYPIPFWCDMAPVRRCSAISKKYSQRWQGKASTSATKHATAFRAESTCGCFSASN